MGFGSAKSLRITSRVIQSSCYHVEARGIHVRRSQYALDCMLEVRLDTKYNSWTAKEVMKKVVGGRDNVKGSQRAG